MQKIKQLVPYIVSALIGIGVAVIINLLFQPLIIQGPSMEPTFSNGDIVRCSTEFTQGTLKRGDIIVFKPHMKQYIKRIIALPGETVEIVDGYIYINGTLLSQYQYENINDAGILSQGAMTLKADEYFCLGDNRNNSRDSRIIGPAKFSQIRYLITEILYKKEKN